MIKKAIILYSCQMYKALLPLVFVPLILNVLGAERYGMIAFFYMLVGLLGLLDVGVSGTFLKLVSTNRGNIKNYKTVTSLFVKVLFLFVTVGSVLYLTFFIKQEYITTNWLNTRVAHDEALYAVKSIGFILALLYVKSYLTSFLNGMEKQELVMVWSVFYNTVFYFGSYVTIKYIESSLFTYFQLMKWLALVDVFAVVFFVGRVYLFHLRCLESSNEVDVNKQAECQGSQLTLSSVVKFSIQLSGLSMIWVIATQVDKFVLSTYIALDEYAKYQIAVQVCSTIAIFSAPLTQMLMPRLSSLYSQNENSEYIKLYCNSILIFIILLAPVGPYFFYFGDELISLWMGNAILGAEINMYAKWLVSAAFIASTMNFIFICLYSVGQIKQHLYVYALYSFFTIPISIYTAKHFGALGSSIFIFVHSLLFMLIWGGVQLRKRFNGFICNFSLIFLGVVSCSSSVFWLLSKMLSSKNMLAITALTPPVINFIILMTVVFVLKNKINAFVAAVRFIPFK